MVMGGIRNPFFHASWEYCGHTFCNSSIFSYFSIDDFKWVRPSVKSMAIFLLYAGRPSVTPSPSLSCRVDVASSKKINGGVVMEFNSSVSAVFFVQNFLLGEIGRLGPI